MNRLSNPIAAFALLFASVTTTGQTLGNYPNTSLQAGKNTNITPGAPHTGTSSIVAYTHTSFTGVLTVNPISGVIMVTDAKQAGIYTVIVKAFGAVAVTKTFTLTVTKPDCSQGLFTNASNVGLGSGPNQ